MKVAANIGKILFAALACSSSVVLQLEGWNGSEIIMKNAAASISWKYSDERSTEADHMSKSIMASNKLSWRPHYHMIIQQWKSRINAICDKYCRLNMVTIETSSTKVIYIAVNLGFIHTPKPFWSSQVLLVLPESSQTHLVLPNSFGPPTMVAAVVNFKDRG